MFDFLSRGVLHLWEIYRLHFNLVPAKENYSVIFCQKLVTSLSFMVRVRFILRSPVWGRPVDELELFRDESSSEGRSFAALISTCKNRHGRQAEFPKASSLGLFTATRMPNSKRGEQFVGGTRFVMPRSHKRGALRGSGLVVAYLLIWLARSR